MHTISLQHVFKSDLNIRDGLRENLKSPKSPPGPWSHAWEVRGLRQPFGSPTPRPVPFGPPGGRGHRLLRAHGSWQPFPCPQRGLRDAG